MWKMGKIWFISSKAGSRHQDPCEEAYMIYASSWTQRECV